MRVVCVVALTLTSAQTYAQCDSMVKPVDASPYTASDSDFLNGFSTLYRGPYTSTTQPFFEGVGSHPGVDVTHDAAGNRLTTDSAVNATCSGEVVRVTRDGLSDGGWGNSVTIRHNVSGIGTIFSAYAHLDRFARPFRVGDQVTTADLFLGYVGTTGASSAVHLHFQIDTELPDRHPFFPNRFPGTDDARLEVDTPDADLYVADRTHSPLALVQLISFPQPNLITFVASGTIDAVGSLAQFFPVLPTPGDRFEMEYTFDPTIPDSNTGSSVGTYVGAVRQVTLRAGTNPPVVFDQAELSTNILTVRATPEFYEYELLVGGRRTTDFSVSFNIRPSQPVELSDALPQIPPATSGFTLAPFALASVNAGGTLDLLQGTVTRFELLGQPVPF